MELESSVGERAHLRGNIRREKGESFREDNAESIAGGSELAFTVEDARGVDSRHAEWSAKNIAIAQVPTRMDFGYTFVGLDPDGHRLRVFAPSQP